MKRPLIAVSAALALLFTSQGVSTATSSPQETEVTDGPGYESVELSHQISWDDASTLSSAEAVVGFRYAGPGVYGEVFGSAEEISLVRESVLADHGYLPAITHALVRDDQRGPKRSTADQAVVGKSADFDSYEPEATVSRGDLWDRTRDILGRETVAHPSAENTARLTSDPEGWAPPSSEVVAKNGFVDENGEPETAHTVSMWLQWNGSAERRPEDFPDDWVLEAELNTYSNNDPHLNPGGLWQRPLCLYDSNENFFWTGSNPNFSIDLNGNFLAWSIATLDQSLVPDTFGAYLDHNLHSDECDRKSIGVGIAYPQDAPLLWLFPVEGVERVSASVRR